MISNHLSPGAHHHWRKSWTNCLHPTHHSHSNPRTVLWVLSSSIPSTSCIWDDYQQITRPVSCYCGARIWGIQCFHMGSFMLQCLEEPLGVKISQVIYLSNLNIYPNFNLFIFLSWHSLSKHSSYTIISGVLFPYYSASCFRLSFSVSYLTYLSSDSLLLWHSYYLSR